LLNSNVFLNVSIIIFLDLYPNQEKLVDLGIFLVNKFARSSDMKRIYLQDIESEDISNGEVMVPIVNQPQFDQFKIPLGVKNTIEHLFIAKKIGKENAEEPYTNKLICRKLLNAVITDDTWAKSKFSTIMKEKDQLFKACKSK
jgi:hypothetical protein